MYSGPPLLGAIESKNGILVKLLLASGANPNAALETKLALYLAREPPIHAAKLIGLRAIADYQATHGAV